MYSIDPFFTTLKSKFLQYITSILGGLIVAFESSIVFFVPCFIATIMDIWAAYQLGKRIHKKHPEKADGKFKSEYKFRIMFTMIIALLAIILANYVDKEILKGNDNFAVRTIVGIFLFYQGWSVLENWSSENSKPMARALQRVMVNKAERHFNTDLKDILLPEEKANPNNKNQM